jgi:hypothetical protein
MFMDDLLEVSGRKRSDGGDDGIGDRLHPQQPPRFVDVRNRKTTGAQSVCSLSDRRGIIRRDAAIWFVQVILEPDADVTAGQRGGRGASGFRRSERAHRPRPVVRKYCK